MSDNAIVLYRPPVKLGRPSEYTAETGERICEAIADGFPIRRFRERDDLPDPLTVYRWEARYPEFHERLACARRAVAARYAETGLERIEAVDPDSEYGSARVSKARDTAGHMRWLAGCLDRDTYGERAPVVAVQVNSTVVSAFGAMYRVQGE